MATPTLPERLEASATQVANLTAANSTLTTANAELTAKVAGLEAKVGELTTALATANTAATDFKAKLDAANTALAAAGTKITDLEAKEQDLSKRAEARAVELMAAVGQDKPAAPGKPTDALVKTEPEAKLTGISRLTAAIATRLSPKK